MFRWSNLRIGSITGLQTHKHSHLWRYQVTCSSGDCSGHKILPTEIRITLLFVLFPEALTDFVTCCNISWLFDIYEVIAQAVSAEPWPKMTRRRIIHSSYLQISAGYRGLESRGGGHMAILCNLPCLEMVIIIILHLLARTATSWLTSLQTRSWAITWSTVLPTVSSGEETLLTEAFLRDFKFIRCVKWGHNQTMKEGRNVLPAGSHPSWNVASCPQ